jgi:hypothetical protein
MDNVPWKKYTLNINFFTQEVLDDLRETINNDTVYNKIVHNVCNRIYVDKHSNYLFFYKPPLDSNTLCYNLDTKKWHYDHFAEVQNNFSKKI